MLAIAWNDGKGHETSPSENLFRQSFTGGIDIIAGDSETGLGGDVTIGGGASASSTGGSLKMSGGKGGASQHSGHVSL